MACRQELAVDSQRLAKTLLRFGVVTPQLEQPAELGETLRHVIVRSAKQLAPDLERLANERLRFLVFPLVPQNGSQSAHGANGILVLFAEGALPVRDHLAQGRLGTGNVPIPVSQGG